MKNAKQRLKQIISFSLTASMIMTSINLVPTKADEVTKEVNQGICLVNGDELQLDKNEEIYHDYDKRILTEEEMNKDDDGDNLTNMYEEIFGTDPKNPDSDGDGLNDYLEIKLALNPLEKDSDNDGINDSYEDSDNDGLNNLDELKYGSDPSKADTDWDNLKDGDEIYKYNTSPILEDTDGDGITDGDEIILNLDPVKKYSDDITFDGDRKIEQKLSERSISPELLKKDCLFKPSVSGSVSGLLDKKVLINSYDKTMLDNNKSIKGEVVEIKFLDEINSQLNLSYECTSFLNDSIENDLRSLSICRYEEGKFSIVDSIRDDENKILSAQISDEGIYFIIDLECFLKDLNLLPSNINVYLSDSYLSDGSDEKADETDKEEGVLLSDYQIVDIDENSIDDADSDNDGINDSEELGQKEEVDLSEFQEALLKNKGIEADEDDLEISTVEVYTYDSNPALTDTDFDGIDDSKDSAPKNNSFSAKLKTSFATSNVSYIMDYRNFFKGNSSYNSNISTISSLYSTLAYTGSSIDGLSIKAFMEKHGLKDVQSYELNKSYTDSDVSQAYIGHREVTYNGVTKEIIAVIVRGTNGTTAEWESNFDIGSTALKSKYSDWKISTNHKGFDVASTRLLKCITQYENSGYLNSSAKKTYWVTGHSRGAALANIMAARLIDSSKEVYAYTFAAPNTTTSSTAANYTGIYNVINKDDFVPCLPMSGWGFNHYGKSYTVSIASNYEKEWESLTGISDYNPDTLGMDDTIKALTAILKTRNDAYVFTCNCHGNGSSNNITIRNYGTSKSSREGAIAKIPSNALPYCAIKRYDGGAFYGWDFTVCQKPEYFMQVLAAFMAGDINAYRFAVELNIADRYESAKSAIIRSGIGGLAHPHYPESYYVLSKHIS